MSKWSVISTRKGWEKKVQRLLAAQGFESYCPVVELKRKWSDRLKRVTSPLFEALVFVRIETEEQRPAVRLTPGVRNFVAANGKPVTVKRKELALLKRLLSSAQAVELACITKAGAEMAPVSAEKLPVRRKTTIVIGSSTYEVRALAAVSKMDVPMATNTLQ